MRKNLGILGSMAKRARSNATRSAKKLTYMAVWGEDPPKQKRSSTKKKEK